MQRTRNQGLKSVRENCIHGEPVEHKLIKPAPEGANQLSPALERWEKWSKTFKSRKDDRVLTQTLKPGQFYTLGDKAEAHGLPESEGKGCFRARRRRTAALLKGIAWD